MESGPFFIGGTIVVFLGYGKEAILVTNVIGDTLQKK